MKYIIDIPKGTPCIHIYKVIDFFHFDVTAIPIDQLTPYIEPEPKKGKWIQIDAGYCDYVKCDKCGDIESWERNYCPNCGADMRGERNET